MKVFLISARGRCGSTPVLHAIKDNIPDIAKVHFELFKLQRGFFVEDNAKAEIEKKYQNNTLNIYKYFLNQAPDALKYILSLNDAKLFYLKRENKLAQWVSHVSTTKTHIFHLYNDEDRRNYVPPKIEFDAQSFINWYSVSMNLENMFLSLTNIEPLIYEQHTITEHAANIINSCLNKEIITSEDFQNITIQKMYTAPLLERFSNPHVVKIFCKQYNFENWIT